MAAERGRRVISKRAGRIAWFVSSIVVVALAITMFAAFSRPTPSVEPLPATRASTGDAGESDYLSGLAALASGETTKAQDLLGSAAAAGNAKAKAKLAELAKKRAGATSGAPAAPTDDQLARPVADVTTLLPASVAGYTASTAEVSSIGAIRSLQPTYEGPYGKVTLVVMSVLDKGSEAGAREYVDQLVRAYPLDGQTVTVGARSARFGTDGSRLAAVAFSRGRYAFEVVATASKPGPAAIRDIAIAAAAAFPAAQ